MSPFVRNVGLFLCFALAGTYAVVTFQGPHGLPALAEKRRMIAILQEENATIMADNQKLAARIQELAKDRAAQELEIRRRLKLLQRDETQFMLPGQKPEN